MMEVSIYNQYLQRIDDKILVLKHLRDTFVAKHRHNVLETIRNRQANDRQWFIKHFNQLYRRRDAFSLGTPNASVIIDCFTIYSIGGCAGYRSISRLPIGRLVKLWDMGFKYQGYPVVEYVKHNGNQRLNYIKGNQLLTKVFKYDENPRFSEALRAMLRNLRNSNELTDNYRTIEELCNEYSIAKSITYSDKKLHFFAE